MKLQDVDIFGRKIFFVVPDANIITTQYLQELCLLGYEAHIIENDGTCSLKDKVDVIIDLFPGCIIYFNVMANISGILWGEYIRALKQKYPDTVLIGILYDFDMEDTKKQVIQKQYIEDIKVKAGCIGLSKANVDNFAAIETVLEKTGAKGRRNFIRVDCDATSVMNFEFAGKKLVGKIQDVNISHFRCLFDSDIELRIFDKIRDARLTINGTTIVSDVVLIMKRQRIGENIGIFMFIHDKPQDTPDLNDKNKEILNKDIFEIMRKKQMQLLQQSFMKLKA